MSSLKANSLKAIGCVDITKLKSIELVVGKIRGLNTFSIDFRNQITAITGISGSGKSSILALIACAYQNISNSNIIAGNLGSAYKVSDFIVQLDDEDKSNNTEIKYVYNTFDPNKKSWKDSSYIINYTPNKSWNKCDNRIKKNVIFIGLTQAVPYFEREIYKQNKSNFTLKNSQFSSDLIEIVSKIFNSQYSNYSNLNFSNNLLPLISSNGSTYSGFNMGMGEVRVLNILELILKSSDNSLILIDEIELGLHDSAQIEFLEELEKVCSERDHQLICTTRSSTILRSIPKEGRIFLQSDLKHTLILPGISPSFASKSLGNPDELNIFVEDWVTKIILEVLLPENILKISKIKKIGSDEAVIRLMASCYLEKRNNCICVLDGDSQRKHQKYVKDLKGWSERRNRNVKIMLDRWIELRIKYLPGSAKPERWLIDLIHFQVNSGNIRLIKDLLRIFEKQEKSEVKRLFDDVKLIDGKAAMRKLESEAGYGEKSSEFTTKLVSVVNDAFPNLLSVISNSIYKFLKPQFDKGMQPLDKHEIIESFVPPNPLD